MYCSECKAEYRSGFTECADCKIPLVSELPKSADEAEPEFVDLEEVVSITNKGEIAFVKSLLEAEKIPYVAQGEHFSTMRAPIPVRFLVPKDQIERAREVLEGFL